MMNKPNRRHFLKIAAASAPLVFSRPFAGMANEPLKRSRVISVKDISVWESNGKIKMEKLDSMLSRGLCTLTGIRDGGKVWQHFFLKSDVVGIKVNCLGGRMLSTHIEIVNSICRNLIKSGIRPGNIIIWERNNRDLIKAGFSIQENKSDIRCIGHESLGSQAYGQKPEIIGEVASRFSGFILDKCSALINLPVLKDHDLAGVSICLKNNFGAIDNPNKYHHNNCNPYVALVNSHPSIKAKTKLNICDALVAQYDGGPGYRPDRAWKCSTMLISQDPVALDRIGLDMIEDQRKRNNLADLRKFGRFPEYLKEAQRLRLGWYERNRIELIDC